VCLKERAADIVGVAAAANCCLLLWHCCNCSGLLIKHALCVKLQQLLSVLLLLLLLLPLLLV
jgi:hypothetical protein